MAVIQSNLKSAHQQAYDPNMLANMPQTNIFGSNYDMFQHMHDPSYNGWDALGDLGSMYLTNMYEKQGLGAIGNNSTIPNDEAYNNAMKTINPDWGNLSTNQLPDNQNIGMQGQTFTPDGTGVTNAVNNYINGSGNRYGFNQAPMIGGDILGTANRLGKTMPLAGEYGTNQPVANNQYANVIDYVPTVQTDNSTQDNNDISNQSQLNPTDTYQGNVQPNQQPAQTTQAQIEQFQQLQTQHPEWFVGDTYVGNDKNAAQAERNRQNAIIEGSKNFGQDDSKPNGTSDYYLKQAFNQQTQQAAQQIQARQQAVDDAQAQQEYNNFAATKAQHPEWFVGDTYVGSDPNAKAKAQRDETIKQAQELAKQRNQEMLDMQDRTAKFQDYQNALPAIKARTMQQLVAKYGVAISRQLEGSINQELDNKTNQLTSAMAQKNSDMLMKYLSGDLTLQGNRQNARIAVEEYNRHAAQIGQPPIDPQFVQDLLNGGKVAVNKTNLGGKWVFTITPADGSLFNDGTAVKTSATYANSVSPDTDQTNKTRIATTQLTNNKDIKIANMNNATSRANNADTNATQMAMANIRAVTAGNEQAQKELESRIAAADDILKDNTASTEAKDNARATITLLGSIHTKKDIEDKLGYPIQ